MVPLKGSSWRFRVTAQRVCPGTTKFADDGTRSFIECQNPVGQSARCDRCSTIDTVFAANMHRAHKLGRAYVDRRFAAHLDQPHRLYVAGFADGSIKVGTTAGASGGVRLAELDGSGMLLRHPGIWCAGEMVDWEAPTGGYLLTACLASGRVAAAGMLRWLGDSRLR